MQARRCIFLSVKWLNELISQILQSFIIAGMQEKVQQPDSSVSMEKKVLFIVNLLLLWALIITYCALSQSLFSTIALIFLIVSVILTIARPYSIGPEPIERVPARERRVYSFPVEKVVWTMFSCLNIAFLAAKIVIYFSFSNDMGEDEKSFLEVSNLELVFIPMIIIPFGIVAAFTPTEIVTLLSFKHKMNQLAPLPLYLVLCLLIILIQIFSVSITGLIYFFITIYLFWMKSFNFKDIFFKVLLITVQVMTTIIISLTFLTTCPYLDTPDSINTFQFLGINSLNDFNSSAFDRGHFICECLLSLMCAWLNRLFIYQTLNTVYLTLYAPYIQVAQLRQPLQEKAIWREEGSPSRRSLKEQLLPQRASAKVTPFKQQMEMRDMSERESFHSDNHETHPKNHQAKEKEQHFLQEVLNFQDENVDETEEEQKARLRRQKKEQSFNWKEVKRSIFTTISTVIHFLNSPQFSLRVIEILSIVVIQRYNNVYSFVNLFWLAFVSSVENLLWIRIFTAFILPLQICNFVITYFYNIPNSPATVITNEQIFGFQYSQQLWLDVIIFSLYINYLILFIKSYRVIKEAAEKKIERGRRRPKTWELIVAFFFRYTYLLTLVALFFLGFSNPTIINIIYVSLFLIFFSNGDNLIFIVRERGRRKRHAITTFSKHYWHVIVYFTLLIIIVKYLYFLFFNGSISNWLDPTGINEVYNWSFNFSLSSQDDSNTTPFFIVFVLAQIQIIIYRSYIYTNYSFSIMADFVGGTSRLAVSIKSKLKRGFIDFVIMANELYYQSLYYVSGFIIIGCSYRWSLIGLAIVILTCIGLLSSFSKKLLGSILFLNLAFLFLNYLILLINEYPIINDAIGQAFIDQINKISLLIGFSLAKDSYASLFVLNIVIFYFCVICYGLSNILQAKEYVDLAPSQSSSRASSIVDDHRQFREPTIVDSEYDDNRFAQNFKRDVIQSTRKFYSQNLIRKYKWVRNTGNFMRMFLTDLVAIFVIVQSLYFRLSISMFLFLLVYLIYYFKLFDNIGSIYDASKFSNRVQAQLDQFARKEKLLENEEHLESLIDDQKQVEDAQTFIVFKAENIQVLKNDSRRQIWKYSAILSVSCLILTYASQFLISEFYTNYIVFSDTEKIEIGLFILGVNSASDLGNYIYFYYLMLAINIIEKLTIAFSERLLHHQNQMAEQEAQSDIKELPKLENPLYLIDRFVSEEFIVEREGRELVGPLEEPISTIAAPLQENCLKEGNLLVYFQYKMVMIRLNVLYGCVHFMIRFYLWLMLINLYSKGNIFALAYLIAVLAFWFRDVNFGLIRNINKAAIIILLLQYFFLLLDINPTTSPIIIPTSDNLSLLQYLIDNPAWVDFLAVSSDADNNDSYLTSFLINSIIIFFTQLCFTIYQEISEVIMRSILGLYRKYESILQKLEGQGCEGEQIQVNLSAYKSWWHRMGVFIYQNLIMNSYLIVSLLMFMLLSGVHNYLAIFLLFIAFLYIYLGIFTALSQREDIFNYTRIFFRIFNILQFIILFISILLNMPFIPTTGNIANVLNEFKALTSIEQIILILFIQVWIDLNASRSFKSMADEYRDQNRKKRNIGLRCLTFQRNNYLLSSLIRQFKQILSFDNNIAQAMNIIKSWHATTKRQMKVIDYDFGTIQQKESTKRIRQEIEEEQIGNDHKPFSAVLKEFALTQTDAPLTFNYYDSLRYITENVGGVIAYDNLQLSAWRFIKEDYDVIEKLLDEFDEQMRLVANDIAQNDSDTITEVLTDAKTQVAHDGNASPQIIRQNFSEKLAIRPENFHQRDKGKFRLIPFLLSNLDAFIVFLVEIYYCVNPCLLSLPLIAFVFCYYLIASRKLTFLLLIYIFLLIFFGELVQILNVSSTPDGQAGLKFFFFIDTDGNISYCLPYLYFLFVVIFVNQEIIRYRGNKFKDCDEVQNLEKAFLRVLMNEEEKSKLYLWKYSQVQHEFLENINPYNIAAYEIENNLEHLFSDDASFFTVFSDRKIGIDLYPPIAAVQIFLTIFLIFFYPLMTDVAGYSIQESTKYYQFSSDMVIGVLVHVVSIVIQRYITVIAIPRKRKIIIKYIYTIVIFILFCWFIYYLAPYKASLTISASFYSPSPALIAFSFFYFIYFFLSALQVKYGFKEFKSFNSLMTRRGYINYYMTSAYTAIPFLYEVKIIMDWTFSNTSLTLFDWFRTFSIYLSSFTSKINYYSATTTTVLGNTIPWYYKIIGWTGFILILLIIFGPMILFSGLNPIAETNLIVSGSMILSLQIKNGNSFTLYETSHFSVPPNIYNEYMFDSQGFDNISVLQQMTTSDISQQFQSITYEAFSDNNWGITNPNYAQILQNINQSISELIAGNTPTYQFQLVTSYLITREVTQTTPSDTSFTYPSDTSYLNLTQLQSIYQTMTVCNSPTNLPNFYISLIRLNTIGNTYKPRPIIYYNNSPTTGQPQEPYLFDVTLNLFCQPGIINISSTNEVYWGLYLPSNGTVNGSQGLVLYVYCDKYQNIIGGYGFTALYTSIILVVAGYIRTLVDGNLPLITYQMNPKPDNILHICEAINSLRVRRQFREEYLMYYQLIDIVRSPEIMKYLSGSYPYLIQQAHEKAIQMQEEKELEKQKTL